MKIVNCEQLSPEWWAARRGLATASCMDRIMTPKTRKLSAQSDDYIAELLGDRLCQLPPYFSGRGKPVTMEMQHGIDTEPEARAFYVMEKNAEVERVGFCVSDCGRFGCSPDGLVNPDGGLEIKVVMPKTQVKYLLAGTVPDEYLCQVHGSLIVTGRKWWDFLSYSPGLNPVIVRTVPDDFTRDLRVALELFAGRYEKAAAKLGIDLKKITDAVPPPAAAQQHAAI